jgi:hypothetical protein
MKGAWFEETQKDKNNVSMRVSRVLKYKIF